LGSAAATNLWCLRILLLSLSAALFVLLVRTFDVERESGSADSASSAATRARVAAMDDGKNVGRRQPVFDEVLAEPAAAESVEAEAAAKGVSSSQRLGSKLQNIISSPSSSSRCPYASLSDLSELERYPKATANRHIVDPPPDTRVTLVCCTTTQGPWNIAVHESWAPLGSARFLEIVRAGYFTRQEPRDRQERQEREEPDADADIGDNDDRYYGVPLMRCVHNFLCQFGLAGGRSRQFKASIVDDPQWLPEGPEHRSNDAGAKRFARGYMSYAGGGTNSRDNQLFVALRDNGPLGGGSPWEVPWGELVGEHSYQTLDRIYTRYGENGPSQQFLWEAGSLAKATKKFPDLDWILSCDVVDEATSL
jgi:cyclophilin family peptidyl-prolyl cis-trans isomerase